MKNQLKTLLRVSVFLLIGAGILYLMYRGQNAKYLAECAQKGIPAEECSLIEKIWQDFLSVNPWWLVGVLLAFMMSNVSRAHRWTMMFHGMGLKARMSTAFFTIMFGYLANLGVPRIGEVLRAAMISRYDGIPLDKTIGTVVIDRVLDVCMLLLIILLAFLFEFDLIYGYMVKNMNRWMIPLAVLGIVGLICLWLLRHRIKRLPIVQKFKTTLMGFRDGLRSIKTVEKPWLFFGHTFFIWFMYFLMNYWCLKAFGATSFLGPDAALIIFVFGALGILFPSPGGMGTYHFMIVTALALYKITSEDAFSFANILYFSVQIFCNVLFGVAALIALPLIHRRQQQESVSAKNLSTN